MADPRAAINDDDLAALVEHAVKRANARMFGALLHDDSDMRAAKFGEAFALYKALTSVRDYLADEVRFSDRCADKGVPAPRNDDAGRGH